MTLKELLKPVWDVVIVPDVGSHLRMIESLKELIPEIHHSDPREIPFMIWDDEASLRISLRGTKLTMEIIDNEQTETYSIG